MLAAFIISAIILFFGILIMGYRIFFSKEGTFPNIHIGGNPGLKKQGISCVTTQDREAQKSKNIANQMVDDLIKNI